MSAHSLATRYAKSLLDLANEKGQVDAIFGDIKSIDAIFEGHRDLKLMFKSPIITADKKLNVVKQLFEGKVNDIFYRFMVLMIKKGRESFFHEIVKAFIIQYNTLKNITPVTLSSAVKLDPAFVQTLISSLKKKENLGEVLLTEKIDETLIGGFVLQYGDKMLNSSVSKSLHGLRNILEDDTYIKKYS